MKKYITVKQRAAIFDLFRMGHLPVQSMSNHCGVTTKKLLRLFCDWMDLEAQEQAQAEDVIIKRASEILRRRSAGNAETKETDNGKA